ncbi:FkbM family methyltransferase [Natrinema pellirubrum DSM 15624]|uniref:FkbM family methyltransferase n=1 Tax=Natrinema pellirubrum (strain DSM 15624 / CIP 106293 / JCM 10476 / NCIMB 786 / 157) TaxID=797303 RepID=L0JHB8_NATP1|nr:hypothetical protein Natpe_1003 [Natrinema pellirubrum DSM 15624]ELY80701.1 FkbM family methyltransferase [Natrinema pellirubrum DSM 15624]
MALLHREYRLFRLEGMGAVTNETRKKFASRFGSTCQLIKPECNRYTIDNASTGFDMSSRHLDRHDFVDDIRSERLLIERVLSIVEADNVFYNIGANIGIYSCLVGSQLSSGRVIAFEPTSDAYDGLYRNIDRNDVRLRPLTSHCRTPTARAGWLWRDRRGTNSLTRVMGPSRSRRDAATTSSTNAVSRRRTSAKSISGEPNISNPRGFARRSAIRPVVVSSVRYTRRRYERSGAVLRRRKRSFRSWALNSSTSATAARTISLRQANRTQMRGNE